MNTETLESAISNLTRNNASCTTPVRAKILKTMKHIKKNNTKINSDSFYGKNINASINGWALKDQTSEPRKNIDGTTKEIISKISEEIKIEYKNIQVATASNMKIAILFSKKIK